MAAQQQGNECRLTAAMHDLTFHNDDSMSSRVQKMVNNPMFSDVTFIVGPTKQRIYAHRLHLATASEYFYSMFYGNLEEAKRDEIELKDEDPETFLSILRLIYGVSVEINYQNLCDINDRIRKYLLPKEYYKPLINFMIGQVDTDTAMKIFRENHQYKFDLVDEVCVSYIQNNPLYFFGKDDFATLEEERVRKIIDLPKINCTEEQLFSALDKWELANPEKDTKELWKLAIRRKRTYLSHKLLFLTDAVWCGGKPEDSNFTLCLNSRKPVSLYGMGIYLLPTDNEVSVKLYMRDIDGVYRPLGGLNLFNRSTPCLEAVDIMFEEVVFLPNKPTTFCLEMQNSAGYIGNPRQPIVETTYDKISFTYKATGHVIPHLWVKYPGSQTALSNFNN